MLRPPEVSTVGRSFPLQSVDGDGGARAEGVSTCHVLWSLILVLVASMTGINNNSDGCNEDTDDVYLPIVSELISSTLRKEAGIGPTSASKAEMAYAENVRPSLKHKARDATR